jgi:glycosyltransferase involved in cell wall biosynthesis
VGGIENVVLNGRTGLLSPAGDAIGLGENLLRVVEDEALRRSLSEHGWEHVRDRFHYSRLVSDTERLYRELLG